MGKKLFISESERQYILNMHSAYKAKQSISEQTDNPDREFIRGIQNFLNERIKAGLVVDGLTDNNLTSKTAKAIQAYQKLLNQLNSKNPATPQIAEDGVWGSETWNAMPDSDKERCKTLIAKEGGIIDQFLNWLGF